MLRAMVHGALYKTTNGGVSWNELLSVSGATVSCSADGMKVATLATGVAISTNGGVTFGSAGNVEATSVAWSSDGSALVAEGEAGILLSTNNGLTWRTALQATTNDWGLIAISADGRCLVAGPGPNEAGPLLISTNVGISWSQAPLTNRLWCALACSGDGRIIIAAANDSSSLILSTNGGRSWRYPPPIGFPHTNVVNYFMALTCSADGSLLVAKVLWTSESIYISCNFGLSWENDDPPDFDGAVSCSADGTVLLAASHDSIAVQKLPPPLRIDASANQQLTLS